MGSALQGPQLVVTPMEVFCGLGKQFPGGGLYGGVGVQRPFYPVPIHVYTILS